MQNFLSKRWIWIVGGILIIGLFVYVSQQSTNQTIIDEAEPNISVETRAALEKQVADAQASLVPGVSIEQSPAQIANIQANLGNAYMSLGKYKLASESFAKSVELMPKEGKFMDLLASSLTARGDYKGAIEVIEDAIKIHPTSVDFWKRRIEIETGKPNVSQNRIKSVYRQAISSTSSNIDLVTAYATYLKSINELEESKKQWEAAAKIRSDQSHIYNAEIAEIDRLLNK